MASKTQAKESSAPKRKTAQPDAVLERFFAGEVVPCPIGCGGFSEPVHVATTERGGGEVWFECTSCALRKRYEIAPSTPAEKGKVTRELNEGREAACPRHGRRVPLRRRGRQLVCPECGVVYRD